MKRYVRRVRPRPATAYLELVFEPGECLQWDWADCGTLPVGQCTRRLHAFVLHHSQTVVIEGPTHRRPMSGDEP